MKKILWIISLLLVSSAAWAASEDIKSLRGDAALDSSSVPVQASEWYDGDGKIQREYVQQPPLIPHAIDGFTVDLKGNSCLSCHDWNSEMPGATKIGISHFVNRDRQALSNMSPSRYFCTQCHVPQKNVRPLISNTFKTMTDE